MTIDYFIIGQRIKELRKSKHMSQAVLSEIIDKSTSYISYLESGIKFMSVETLINIANALNVTTDMILGEYLTNHMMVSTTTFESVLKDCTQYECRVIIDNAKTLKAAMRENRSLSHK